jgi:methylmalonyl-CoA mutase N-terminal domain/subunit
LTNKIEQGIEEYIARIDEMGGALEAIKKGYIQREIRRSAYDYQKAVDSGEQIVVGVNKFASTEESEIKILEIDEGIEQKQTERLKKLKRERDNARVKEILDEVRRVARGDKNIMPVLIDAVKSYATVGEISDVLRDVFGEYKELSVL